MALPLVRLARRHPPAAMGVVCFLIAFGTISANALWYQPGQHPAPFLRTRDAADFTALTTAARSRNSQNEGEDQAPVTTFRIAREEDLSLNEAPPSAAGGISAAASAAKPLTDLPADASDTEELIRRVQRELSRRGLYDGDADGVIGPRTETAIALFQKSVAMEANGLVSPELLAALALDNTITSVVPTARPSPELSAGQDDPVAAAIRQAQIEVQTQSQPVTAPRRPVSTVAAPVPPRAVGERDLRAPPMESARFDPGIVMDIQRGLANLAYTDVVIDGMPGEETRAAIRRFERHYQLPETGEPSQAVLDKLKSIGAL